MAYTHRERVLAALNLEEPDRVPVDLMGHACMLNDETYLRFRDHLGAVAEPQIDTRRSFYYMEEMLRMVSTPDAFLGYII